jgi:fructose-bisphosphate aldolase class 1
MRHTQRETTARTLVAKGKGLLAVVENFPTMQKRFVALNTRKGSAATVAAARSRFYHRATCNNATRYGTYSNQMEKMAA